MESDQNRPQAGDAERRPGGQGRDQDQGHSGEAEFSGYKAERPQAGHSARSTADAERGFTAEPDFSGFKPVVRETLLPRWLHVSLLWVLGLGVAAAMVLAGMFVNQERKTDKTLELLAASSRGGLDVPAVAAVVPLAPEKPTDMVFQPKAVAESAPSPAPAVAAKQVRPGAGTAPAVARVAKAAPAKAKPIAKKKKPKRKTATALARRTETQTWPRRRGDSITERLNAAVRACRARPHAPGECNLRACDILGSSDPACR